MSISHPHPFSSPLIAGHSKTRWWTRTKRYLSDWIKHIQYGQMLKVLNGMQDHQLRQLGINREDIPSHARRMIYHVE